MKNNFIYFIILLFVGCVPMKKEVIQDKLVQQDAIIELKKDILVDTIIDKMIIKIIHDSINEKFFFMINETIVVSEGYGYVSKDCDNCTGFVAFDLNDTPLPNDRITYVKDKDILIYPCNLAGGALCIYVFFLKKQGLRKFIKIPNDDKIFIDMIIYNTSKNCIITSKPHSFKERGKATITEYAILNDSILEQKTEEIDWNSYENILAKSNDDLITYKILNKYLKK